MAIVYLFVSTSEGCEVNLNFKCRVRIISMLQKNASIINAEASVLYAGVLRFASISAYVGAVKYVAEARYANMV